MKDIITICALPICSKFMNILFAIIIIIIIPIIIIIMYSDMLLHSKQIRNLCIGPCVSFKFGLIVLAENQCISLPTIEKQMLLDLPRFSMKEWILVFDFFLLDESIKTPKSSQIGIFCICLKLDVDWKRIWAETNIKFIVQQQLLRWKQLYWVLEHRIMSIHMLNMYMKS